MKDLLTALGFIAAIIMAHALPEFIVRTAPAWFNAFLAISFIFGIIGVMIWGVKRLIERLN